MLKLLDITKEYKVDEESILALHGVSIEFRKNEFVSILGPSGCGKTTLLNIIGGLDRYTSGDIQIDGVSTKEYDDVDWDTYRNRRIGFVFQSYNLIPHMNILKNVSMSLTLAGVDKDERKRRALEALRRVGLEDQARKKPNQLSGGQMQRVAIARALVNNPEIILADEPTGALDSESGIQVMDLLKEVAEDRLVIMVTHNPLIAEEYSTRIVYLKDGEVEGDTMPFSADAEEKAIGAESESGIAEAKIQACADNIDEESARQQAQQKKSVKCKYEKKPTKYQLYMRKVREHDKSSMKIKTAVSLSFNNLLSKKGRTFLTSLAGSIGILGIILVLALASGVDTYVRSIEENALSQYPISISKSGLSLSSLIGMLGGENSSNPDYPDTDEIYANVVLGNIMNNLELFMGENKLDELKTYLDENFDQNLGQIRYKYGTTFNVYSNNYQGVDKYTKVYPFTEVMGEVLSDMGDILGGLGNLAQYATMFDAWSEISGNQQLLDKQYDLLGASRWPSNYDELVIVLDEKNQINDYALFMLGLISGDDMAAVLDPDALKGVKFSVDDLLNLDYRVMTNADYLVQGEDGYWTDVRVKDNVKAEKNLPENFISDDDIREEHSFKLKVVGVVRPKAGAVVTSINGVVGYTQALTEKLITRVATSEVVQAMEENRDATGFKSQITYTTAVDNTQQGQTVIAGQTYADSDSLYDSIMISLGLADLNNPASIEIFSASFEAKDKIVALLDRFVDSSDRGVIYSDNLAMIMGYVGTLTDTVTGVLIGFAAISLVVSTIMIAIIIYTSVLERKKEIGVLRSLGARKKDISRVFLAESAMIGLFSGTLGLIASGILSAIGNVILLGVFKIPNLMSVQWWHCIMMLFISVLLSMFAGFIPSRIASNKDPATALRSE